MDISVYEFSPSGIQALVIPQMVKGYDILAQSRSGTGKTAAFAISAIARTDFKKREPQVLIMAPNSHLAFQISKVEFHCSYLLSKLINELAKLIEKEASVCLTEVSSGICNQCYVELFSARGYFQTERKCSLYCSWNAFTH